LPWAFRQAPLKDVEVPATVMVFLLFEDSAPAYPIHHLLHLSNDIIPIVAFQAAEKYRNNAPIGIQYELRISE
jgi:hypothetical protein